MRSQVAIAGRGQRIDIAMRPQSLESVAEAGGRMPVIDQQGSPALIHEARAKLIHESMAGRADFENFAVLRCGVDMELGGRGDAEGKLALAVEPHGALPPLGADARELAHREGVEELVADDDGGSVRHVLETLRP